MERLGIAVLQGICIICHSFHLCVTCNIDIRATMGIAAVSLANSYMGMMPEGIMSSIISGDVSPQVIGQTVSQNWYAMLPALVAMAPILLLGAVLLLIALYLTPIAILNYLQNRKFGKAFDIKLCCKEGFQCKIFYSLASSRHNINHRFIHSQYDTNHRHADSFLYYRCDNIQHAWRCSERN